MPYIKKPSIVFFGTGPVADASLRSLLPYFEIERIITKKRPSHHTDPAPLEVLAKENGLDILFANSKDEVNHTLKLGGLKSSLGLVIDFGVILSGFAINSFEKGIINSHFSLLPRWRGADPITYSILKGDEKTGVSLMKIVEELDAGPLIAQKSIQMDEKIGSIQLTTQLIELSNSLLIEYLPKYLSGSISPKPQPALEPTHSSKIKKSDGIINWNTLAIQIEREIRAYKGWPKSRTTLGTIEIIITEAEISDRTADKPADYKIKNNFLLISAKDKYLLIKRLQPAGKKEMSTEEFLRGYGKQLIEA